MMSYDFTMGFLICAVLFLVLAGLTGAGISALVVTRKSNGKRASN